MDWQLGGPIRMDTSANIFIQWCAQNYVHYILTTYTTMQEKIYQHMSVLEEGSRPQVLHNKCFKISSSL